VAAPAAPAERVVAATAATIALPRVSFESMRGLLEVRGEFATTSLRMAAAMNATGASGTIAGAGLGAVPAVWSRLATRR